MSSSSRRKKRNKRKAKQTQKLTWMVELRMLGWSKERVMRIRDAGNYTEARRAYESMLSKKPEDESGWVNSFWGKALAGQIGMVDRFNFVTSPLKGNSNGKTS